MKKNEWKLWVYQKKLRKVLLIMKLSILLLVFGQMVVFANAKAQVKIDIPRQTMTYEELFREINKQTGMTVVYSNDQLNRTQSIEVRARGRELKEVLTDVLKGTGLSFEFRDEFVVLQRAPKPELQQQVPNLIEIKGKVTDEKGNPMPGATITVYGTTQGVIANADGHFTIMAQPDGILRFSFVGYKSEDVSIKGKKTINVSLKPEAANLDEVTVVAFGTQKKESVVGAIQTVRPMDLKSSSSDLTTSFAGKIAGIIGWQTGGQPGALTEEEMNTKFYIRGISSSNGASEPLVLIDGVESSRLDLARLVPEDIESFSVLKDASATAMYGARGANGVILVTTKKGEAGSVYTSVRYEAVASMPTDVIDVVDPKTYMKMYNQALLARNPGAEPQYSLNRIERTGSKDYPSWVYPANDWFKTLFKDMTINHRVGVNVRGGSETVQYYAAVNYTNDQGMLKTDRLNQFDVNIKNSTLSSRLNLNVNLTTGIRLLVNTAINYDKYHGPRPVYANDIEREFYDLAFNASPVNFAPTYPGDKEHGWPHLRFGSVPKGDGVAPNPYAMIQSGYQDRSRYSAVSKIEYIHNLSSLLKGLELRGSVALSKTGYEMNAFENQPFYYMLDAENGGYDFETGEHTLTLLSNGRRTLEKPRMGKGSASSSSTQLVYEARLLHTAAWGGTDADRHQTSLIAVFQAQQANSAPVQGLFDSFEQRNLSFSMRGTYGFLDRYFVEASFGYNGSERFTKNNRMGFFPAVGGAWLISKENFMQGDINNWISFLKVRGSWGKVGNDGIIKDPRFVYMPEIVGGPPIYNDPEPGSQQQLYRKRIKNYGDPDVKWEISEQINLGLETRFFKDILEINADIYQELRHNIIEYRVTIPAQVGVEVNPLDNMGTVRSRGIDISAKVQHAFNKDFWIILNGTLTYGKAVYKKLEEAKDRPWWQLKTGYEISQKVGYIAEGLFRDQAEIDNSPQANTGVMPGDIRYRDVNDDNIIDIEDAVHIGFPETPRLIYGFSGFINYKNWEFNFAFQGSGKRGFFIEPKALSPFENDRAMLQVIANSHWTEKNVENRPFWPRLSVQNITTYNKQEDWSNNQTDDRRSTYFMRECSFLRCTSLELAYNLPLSIRQKLRMENVKFFARANNPFMFSNFKLWDVELGGYGFNYPIQKTYALGVNISF